MLIRSVVAARLCLIGLLAGGPVAVAETDVFDAMISGDYAAAADFWRPLAEKGDAAAQFNLALLYHAGLGVERSEAEAVKWYKRAAENGHVRAQEYLVVGYREGWFGLPHDEKLVSYWESRLASSGL